MVLCRGAMPFCLPEKVLDRCQYSRQKHLCQKMAATNMIGCSADELAGSSSAVALISNLSFFDDKS